ncbi:MAG: helix-turn-helix domain-containing protein [Thermoplasmata archaeon]
MRRSTRIALSSEELARLRGWVDDTGTPTRVRDRARILLWSAAGHSDSDIATGLGKDVATVALWRRRFLLHGLSGGLRDAPRPGRKPKHRDSLNDRILDATFNEQPPRGARWSTRALAERFGVSHMVVQRLWQSQGVGAKTSYRIPDRLASAQLPFVDLLGVILQPPTRVVIIGVELTGESRIAHVEPLFQTLRTEISGGHLFHSVRADPDDLIALLGGFHEIPAGPTGRRLQLGNLLILLREIDERTSASTRVHLLAEGRGAAKDPRLAAWMRLHPRFVLHNLPVGVEWEREVGRFVHQWHSVSLRSGSFQGVSSFTRAAARFAARPPAHRDGMAWSIGPALDHAPALYISGGANSGDPASLPDPDATSSNRFSPSEKQRFSEKFSLRTVGP